LQRSHTVSSTRAMEPGHLLHSSLICPSSGNVRHNSNRDSHLYPPHNSLVHLTTKTEVRRSGRITDGMPSGLRAQRDSVLSSQTSAPTLPEWPFQTQRGLCLTAPAPASGISAPVYTKGVWPPLRLVSLAQRNKPSTIATHETYEAIIIR